MMEISHYMKHIHLKEMEKSLSRIDYQKKYDLNIYNECFAEKCSDDDLNLSETNI